MEEKDRQQKMKCVVSMAHSALPDQPWPRLRRLKNTAGIIVQHRLHIPQTHIVREFFSTTNVIDTITMGKVYLALKRYGRLQIGGSICFSSFYGFQLNTYLAYCYFQDKPHAFLIQIL